MREIRKNMTNCQYCKRPFEAQKATAKYCSGKCRAEDSRKRRRQEVLDALADAERALRRAKQAASGEEERDCNVR